MRPSNLQPVHEQPTYPGDNILVNLPADVKPWIIIRSPPAPVTAPNFFGTKLALKIGSI